MVYFACDQFSRRDSNPCFVAYISSVEAISTNSQLVSSSSGIKPIVFYWGAVADGFNIAVSTNDTLREDQQFSFNVTFNGIDVDGSEILGEYAYLRLDDNAILVNSSAFEYFAGPFTYQNVSLGGTWKIRVSDLKTLRILPKLHWHGLLKGTIYVNATDSPSLDMNAAVKMSIGQFSFNIQAVADRPQLTVPSATVFVNENSFAVLPNLSAILVDNITANGAEYLSVIFSNVPEDSFFSKGAPSLNGRCTAKLAWRTSLNPNF